MSLNPGLNQIVWEALFEVQCVFIFCDIAASIDVFPLGEMLILKSRFKREKKRQNFCLPKPERVLYVAKCGSGAEKGLGNPQCCY